MSYTLCIVMIFLCNFCIAVCLPCFYVLEPRYALSFSLKSPSMRTPPGSPHRAPSKRDAPLLEPSFIHLSTSPLYEPLSRFPSGATMEMPVSSAFSTYLPGSPVMKPPHQVPHTEFPQRRSTPRVPFVRLSKSLVNEPPSRFPSGARVERDSHFQNLFYITFRVLRKGSPLQVPLTGRPQRRMLRFQCPPSTISQSSR